MSDPYYCFTTWGLEEIAAGEIKRSLPGARMRSASKGKGVVHFDYDGDEHALLELATVEDVFVLLAREQISADRQGMVQVERAVAQSPYFERALATYRQVQPRKTKRVTYRVVAQRRHSRQPHVRKLMQEHVSMAVRQRFPRWHEVEDDALIEVWVLHDGNQVLCGLRLSDRTMRHRTYKQAHIKASLRPTIARSMVVLSEPADDDVFLDPMCGGGTLLIERGEHGRYGKLLGGDSNREAVEATRANIGARYKPIEIEEWDATQLPLAENSVTRIVSNLPFGKKVVARQGIQVLYARFIDESQRVLCRDGIMVLLTSERQVLLDVLQQRRLQAALHEISVLGQKAFIFKIGAGDFSAR